MTIEKQQHGYNFKFPANEEGYKFVEEVKKNLNKDSYKVTVRFSGPDSGGYVRKEDATHLRIYITSLRACDSIDKWHWVHKGAEQARESNKQLIVQLKSELREANEKLQNVDTLVALNNEGTLQEENELLKGKLSLLTSYIKSIGNSSHNRSRRIEGLKEVTKTINKISSIRENR